MSEFKHTRGKYKKPTQFSLLPDGNYEIVCTASNFVNNNAGTGKVLKLIFNIVSGEYKNRKHYDNLNLVYPESWVVNAGINTLNGILEAINKPNMTDTDELLGARLWVEINNWIDKKGTDKQTFIYYQNQMSETDINNDNAGVCQPTEIETSPSQTDEDVPF